MGDLSATFLAQMETVLHTYSLPYNPKRPVVCFDERPCFLIGDVLQPIPMSKGQSQREDYQYEKHGSCSILLAFEPHTGRRWLKVYTQRTAKEYTHFMRYLAGQFPQAERITLVQDNLNTHHPGSFYTQLDPRIAFDLAQRFTWTYTPKHASWLNRVELEFSALARQCLNRRISSQVLLQKEALPWAKARNKAQIKVSWQFSIQTARSKLQRHYKRART